MVEKKKKKFPPGLEEERDKVRAEAIKELFVIREGELPMKTETPPRKIDAFVMMEVVEYMFTLPKQNGKRGPLPLLSKVYRDAHDIRMISKSRKGRIEIEKILATQGRDELEEMGI